MTLLEALSAHAPIVTTPVGSIAEYFEHEVHCLFVPPGDTGVGDIMDTPAEAAYNDIAALASACCGSEIAAVNFVDDQRHWTKAIVGVQDGRGASVSADVSFCAETVAGPHGLLSVPDTLAGRRVSIRISLDGDLRVYDADHLPTRKPTRAAKLRAISERSGKSSA